MNIIERNMVIISVTFHRYKDISKGNLLTATTLSPFYSSSYQQLHKTDESSRILIYC